MTENNLYNDRANQPGSEGRRNQDRRNKEEGASERWLEAALARYAAAEPRAGLEERILANLRGVNLREDGLRANLQSKSAPVFSLWRRWLVWIAAGAAAAMVLVALARKPGSVPPHPEKHGSVVVAGQRHGRGSSGPEGSGANEENRAHAHPWAAHGARHRAAEKHIPETQTANAAWPKLEQFPSPRPLSEQERLLADYIAAHHTQAVLVARARMAALQKDLAEEKQGASGQGPRSDDDSRSNQDSKNDSKNDF